MMKVFLYVSPTLRRFTFHEGYVKLLSSCERADTLADADVVHLLGTWDYRLARIASRARKMGIPYIVSPLGGISAWNMKKPATRRPLQRMLYLRRMIRHAGAIVATTSLEKDFILRTQWNKLVMTIPNAFLTHRISVEDMLEQMSRLYADVLQHHEEVKATAIARKVKGMLKDELDDERARIEEHSTDDTKPDIKPVDGYPREQDILRQIMQIHSRMPHANIPHNYLDELQHLLHDTDYDEDLLCSTLKRMKLLGYSRELFEVMTKETGLTEGFMPAEAKQGRTAKRIKKIITKDTH